MTKSLKLLLILGTLCVFTSSGSAYAQDLEKVSLHLKWMHQFQFAGYYAALEQGFYQDEGLEVTIKAASADSTALDAVFSGDAEYGVWNSGLLIERLLGRPVVVLAVIFQHSPDVVLTRFDRGIRHPSDLVGRTIMVVSDMDKAILKALLIHEGVSPEGVELVPNTWRINDIVDGKVDGVMCYITDQPNQMQLLGVPPFILRPIDYGIDFYGDCLFTSESEIKHHPERAAAFRRASIKGWAYALTHVDEMISHILELPGVRERGLSVDQLRYEAEQMQLLIQPIHIEIGHINPGRWNHIADTYISLGMLEKEYSLDGFIFDPNASESIWQLKIIWGSLAVIVAVVLIVVFWNWQLRKQVVARTRELIESEKRFRHLAENAPEMTYRMSLPEGHYEYVSPASIEIFGYSPEEFIQTPILIKNAIHPDWQDYFRKEWEALLQGNMPPNYEYQIIHGKTGEACWIYQRNVLVRDLAGNTVAIEGMASDVTARMLAEKEKNELEIQLRQAQKMEAVGLLAGGVAHDFNNILHVILGYGELATDEAKSNPPVQKSIAEMMKAGERAKTLVSQLLAFSRRQVLEMKDVDLNVLLTDLVSMLQRLIGDHITLEIIPGHNLGTVSVDKGQIEQIITNLCVNSRDAMPDGGIISIDTENVRIDEEYGRTHTWAKAGRFVLLSVTDSGCGMEEEVVKHVFEPFFTTKEVGRGTGLGLATVYGLVKQHKGMITIYSEVGQGTTVKIYLPLVERIATAVGDKITGPVPGGTETILLAEDDDAVRSLSRDFLERAGYTVLTAADGVQALSLFKEHGETIDLALLDVMMPNLGGRAVYDQIQSKNSKTRFLFASGFSMNAIHTNFILDEGLTIVQKPFQRVDLLRKVREMLDS